MNISDGVVESHEENIDEEVPENDKDKQIELLKEEVYIYNIQ